MNRLFFVAGESSGDIHGANLILALKQQRPDIVCEGLGGTRMAAAGMNLRYDLAGQAIMGFVEVVKSLRFIRRLFHESLDYIQQHRPDAVVLIDYPGFNIELAKRVKLLGIPIVYYISPQVWAWKKKRIHTLARLVDKMLVILPFEEKLYRDLGVDCTYVGHPLMDHIPRVPVEALWPAKQVIGLLPGSREQEIGRILPPMLDVAQALRGRHPEAVFAAPCVDDARARQIRALAGNFPLEIHVSKTYDVLTAARFCMVASGTATVEAALFGVPFIILYRVAPITYTLARMLVRVDHIGMVNILAGKRIVPEFVQHDATVDRILPVAHELLGDTPARAAMIEELGRVRHALGGPGASDRAALEILSLLKAKTHA